MLTYSKKHNKLNLKIYIFNAFILLSGNMYSQKSSYIGFELGKNFYHYKETDTGHGLVKDLGAYNASFDIQYIHRVNKSFSIETGLIYTLYYQQYSTRLYPAAANEVYKSILIPIRINYSKSLFKDKIEFHVYGGYSQGIKLDKFTDNYRGIFYDINTGLYDSITRGTFYNNKYQFYGIIDVGGRIMINLHKRLALSLNANIGRGLKSIANFKFYYNNGSGKNDYYAEQHNYGHYHNFRVGLNYRFYRKKPS
jgi:hypothetical protein